MLKFLFTHPGIPIATALEISVLVTILYRKSHREWPAVLAYCCAALLFDIGLLTHSTHSAPYRDLYWTWLFLAPLLRLFILGDVVRSIPAVEIIRTNIQLLIASASTTLAVIAGFATTLNPSHLRGAANILTQIDCGISVGWGAFLVVALISIQVSRAGWDRTGARVVIGLSAYVIGSMCAAWSYKTFPNSTTLYLCLRAATAIVTFSIWQIALASKPHDFLNSSNQGPIHPIEKAGTS